MMVLNKQKTDLSVEFCGFRCENPFLLAASPVARTAEMISRAFDQGWAGGVTKSVSLDQDLPDHSLSPRFAGLRTGGSGLSLQKNAVGLGNLDFRIDKGVQETFDDFARLKKDYPHKLLIISIKAPFVQEEWQRLAGLAAAAGADGIELCLSCPDAGTGGSIGQHPVSTRQVLSWVAAVTSLPKVVKLTPHVASLAEVAQAAAEGGAVAASAINTIKSMGGFNLEGLKPLPTVLGQSTSVGASGRIIKPFAQYCVYEIANAQTPLQISGVGGVGCAQDAIEYLLLGASTIQCATQIMYEGYEFVEDLRHGLARFLVDHGLQNVTQLIGAALPNYVPSTAQLSRRQQLKSNIDQDFCIHCGRCHVACRDGAYQAVSFSTERKAAVDHEKCVGCGLCRLVCPVPQAIYLTAENGGQTQRKEKLN